jgi:hypothetical protein
VALSCVVSMCSSVAVGLEDLPSVIWISPLLSDAWPPCLRLRRRFQCLRQYLACMRYSLVVRRSTVSILRETTSGAASHEFRCIFPGFGPSKVGYKAFLDVVLWI